MSKGMNVTIWPLWDDGFGDFYADTPSRAMPTRVDFAVYAKRLKDTELAAEVWHAVADRTMNASNVMMGDNYKNPYAQTAFQKSIDHALTLHRFATLPHASETNYE